MPDGTLPGVLHLHSPWNAAPWVLRAWNEIDAPRQDRQYPRTVVVLSTVMTVAWQERACLLETMGRFSACTHPGIRCSKVLRSPGDKNRRRQDRQPIPHERLWLRYLYKDNMLPA
jgi:hypothetical protein